MKSWGRWLLSLYILASYLGYAWAQEPIVVSPPLAVPYIFTMDDFPMWFVGDSQERLDAFDGYKNVLAAHGIQNPIMFVNGASLRDLEWQRLNEYRQNAGWILANHGARHWVTTQRSEAEFYSDVDLNSDLLSQWASGWDSVFRFFRFPNSDWGTNSEFNCRRIAWERGFTIVPVTTDLKDHELNRPYHEAVSLGADGEARAQEVYQQALEALRLQFNARWEQRQILQKNPAEPEIFVIHSARLSRDHLDDFLTALEKLGVQWVAPSTQIFRQYFSQSQQGQCVIACKIQGTCR